jgi:hypothetical protein
MIAFTAWSQRRESKLFTEKIQTFLMNHLERPVTVDDLEPKRLEGQLHRAHPWTDVHSFYVLSGGFAFSTYDLPSEEKFLPGKRNRVILSMDGVIWLARNEPSLLPDLSQAEINDKSKANHLAKTIICIQATWFIAQCISRMAQGLAISLLELSTFTHTLCTLITYGSWWDKPLGIEEPTRTTGENIHSICAMLCCRSTFDDHRDLSSLRMRPNKDYKHVQLHLGNSSIPLHKTVPGALYMGQGIANFHFESIHSSISIQNRESYTS